MHDPAGTCGSHAAGNLQSVGDGLARGQRSLRQPGAQRLAVHQFGDDEGRARLAFACRRFTAEFEDGQNVRVRELGDAQGLALEAGQCLGIRGECGTKDLDGHLTIESRVAGAIDLAHAPCTEWTYNFILSEKGADREGHGVPGL